MEMIRPIKHKLTLSVDKKILEDFRDLFPNANISYMLEQTLDEKVSYVKRLRS